MLISILQKGPYAKTLARCLQLDPERVHRSEFAYGNAMVFFPILEEDQTEVTLIMEVAEERLPREGVFTGAGHPLRQYVHTRAYSANALLALAIGKAYEKAIAAAEQTARQLEISISAVETNLDCTTLNAWFRPLGWQLTIVPLSDAGASSPCLDIILKGKHSVADALAQLQVLLCALDADHIYWIGEAATRSMLEVANSSLKGHPHLEAIIHSLARFPEHGKRLALGNLMEEDDVASQSTTVSAPSDEELKALYHQVSKLCVDQTFPNILLMMPERGQWGTAYALDDAVAKVTLSHPEVAVLQAAINSLNAGTTLSLDQKQKLKLISNSPLFKNPLLLGHELVIVADFLSLFPKWHRPAMENMIFEFLAAKRIVWIETDPTAFENWASQIASNHPYDVQVLRAETEFPQMQIACFDLQTKN